MILLKKKKNVLIALSALFTLCIGVGITSYDAVSAQAASADYDISMTNGASTRKDDKQAIRFETKVLKSDIDDNQATAKVVTLITPTRYLKAAKIAEADFTKETLDENEIAYKEIVFSVANKNLVDTDGYTVPTEGNYYLYHACLYDIQEHNIAQEFSARSYIQVGETIEYTAYSEANNSRSIYETAEAHLAKYPDLDKEGSEYLNVSALCANSTYTVNGFDGAQDTLVVRRGESLQDYTETLKALNVDGCAYYNGTAAYTDGSAVDITAKVTAQNATSAEITLGMNALAFAAIDGGYTVSKGTLTKEDTSKVVVPATYNGQTVIKLASKAFNGAPFVTVILPATLTAQGGEDFTNSTALKYLDARGLSGDLYDKMFTNCCNLQTLVLGNNTKLDRQDKVLVESNKPDYMQNGAGVQGMDIYLNATPSDTISLTLGNENLTNELRLFSGKIYLYSATEAAGCYYFDATTGLATPWNEESYYIYSGGKVVAGWAPAFTYSVNATNKTCTITAIAFGAEFAEKFPDGVVTVPAKYNDGTTEYTVTALGTNAAKGNTYIKKLILPETVTTLGSDALRNCSYLEYLDAKGLTGTLGGFVRGCNKLTTLVIGNNVTLSGSYWKAEYDSTKNMVDVYIHVQEGATATFTIPDTVTATKLSGKFYVYSETQVAGGYKYDETTGLATAYDANSYYEYIDGALTLHEATA